MERWSSTEILKRAASRKIEQKYTDNNMHYDSLIDHCFVFIITELFFWTFVCCQIYLFQNFMVVSSEACLSDQMLQCFILVPLLLGSHFREKCWAEQSIFIFELNLYSMFSNLPIKGLLVFLKIHKKWDRNCEMLYFFNRNGVKSIILKSWNNSILW